MERERERERELQDFVGSFRVSTSAGSPVYGSISSGGPQTHLPKHAEFSVVETAFGQDGDLKGAVLGRRDDGSWALLCSPTQGVVSELIVQGYNEKPRKPAPYLGPPS